MIKLYTESVWTDPNRERWFIIPNDRPIAAGEYRISSPTGGMATCDLGWLTQFETSEEEARDWAKEELGYTLDELKRRIDAKLARTRSRLDEVKRTPVVEDTAITPDTFPAVFTLVMSLPRVIADSLSGEPARVIKANGELAALQQRLNAAGIDVDRSLADFPKRLASLRNEFNARRPPKKDAGHDW